MRLGVKFVIALVVPMALLTAALGFVSQMRNYRVLSTELAKEGRAMAVVVQAVAEDYLEGGGTSKLPALAEAIANYPRLFGLRLFGPDGRLLYQTASLDTFPFRDKARLGRVLEGRQAVQMRESIGGQPVLEYLFPLVAHDGRMLGAGEMIQLESYIRPDTDLSRDFIIIRSLVLLLATVIIVLVITRLSVTRPIEDLVRSFRQVGTGDRPARVPVQGNDELARLAAEFNGMVDRLEATQRSLEQEQHMRQEIEGRLRNEDRLAGLGRLSAGLAHEIGTPLNVISGRAEALERRLGHDPQAARSLQDITAQTDRIVRIVRDMLDFARMKAPRRQPVAIERVLRTVLDMADSQLSRGRVDVRLEMPPDLPAVVADADQLQQVFLNLVLNAIDAMPQGGSLRISAEERTRPHPDTAGPPRRWLAVDVRDSGAGIPPENRDRLFDPFFTTKDPGKGTGLGLSVSYGIVQEHGGWFDLESRPGEGTCMTVYLPLEAAAVLRGEGA